MMTLIVKGDFRTAAREAMARGFEGITVRGEHSSHTTIDALPTPAHYLLAASWLCEPDVLTAGEGYPAGTLLFYR